MELNVNTKNALNYPLHFWPCTWMSKSLKCSPFKQKRGQFDNQMGDPVSLWIGHHFIVIERTRVEQWISHARKYYKVVNIAQVSTYRTYSYYHPGRLCQIWGKNRGGRAYNFSKSWPHIIIFFCHHFRWYATLKNKTPAETFPRFPSVLRVIDRSDRNPLITVC